LKKIIHNSSQILSVIRLSVVALNVVAPIIFTEQRSDLKLGVAHDAAVAVAAFAAVAWVVRWDPSDKPA
jgi:hypothetical protein